MAEENPTTRTSSPNEFARGAEKAQTGLFGEYVHFLRSERNLCLAPVLLSLLLAGAFVILGGTAAAPLIYALF